jgi:hypothetical protein
LYQTLVVWIGVSQKRPTKNVGRLRLSRFLAFLDELPELARLAQLGVF